ncbi:hypothetical protein NFI96_030119 [Prochilodus magdalenae]|nr:hypothetical protein NFI96_030119 [Prochilodus magdalenae]
MDSKPDFRRENDGELTLRASPAALAPDSPLPPRASSKERQPRKAPEPTDAEMLECAMEVDVAAPPSAPAVPPAPPATSRPRRKATQRSEAPPAAPEGPVLPPSWKHHLPKEQHDWVSRALFKSDKAGKAVLVDGLQMWWYPPPPPPVHHQPPSSPDAFFTRPFCLWMPYRMWAIKLLCKQANCHRVGQHLTSCGLYKTVRRVLDIDGWYFMATEYLECHRCRKKVAGWSQDILEQLDPAHRARFPAILTYRLSCDMKVVRLMRERSLGNSTTMLYHKLREQHSEAWMSRTLQYLAVCKKFQVPGVEVQHVVPPPPMVPIPSPHWLLTIHARDVRTRIGEMKARVTSIFGSILKIHSTKKVVKKLAGAAAGTAAWVTNVGNEHGQILMSVLTAHEGAGLLPMAAGLMGRYADAGVPPPKLLYVDRDCCSGTGRSRAAAMFHKWEELVVRLDVWHLMRRFAVGVTTDSHQLYGLFMAKLSACIFEWDAADVARLREAVEAEMEEKQGIVGLTEEQLNSKLTPKLLGRHCRRHTRGAQETEELIDQLLAAFRGVADTMGIPLLDAERMGAIWETQRQHLSCVQDPPGLQLYTKTGQVTRGGVILPVYRCARGCTSLESFHLHLNHFIPGTSANAENFQAYLLEGLVRWNEDHAATAADQAGQVLRCYSGHLQHSLNELSQQLLGYKLVEDCTKPGEYTGELIGVEYLYSQQCRELREDIGRDPDAPDGDPDDEPECEEEPLPSRYLGDEGDLTFAPLTATDPRHGLPVARAEPEAPPSRALSVDAPTAPAPPPSVGATSVVDDADVFRGPDGALGYDRVVRLARHLVELRDEPCFSERHVADIVALWNSLPEVDRQRVSYLARHRERLPEGQFKASHSKAAVCSGTESLKRSLLGQGTRPAQWPNASRLVEAICLELCAIHPRGQKIAGVKVNRWAVILHDYGRIRRMVLNSPALMKATALQLFEINQRTLSVWHNNLQKKQELAVLAMEIPVPNPGLTAAIPLSEPRQRVPEPEHPKPFKYPSPLDLSGKAVRRGPRPVPASASAVPFTDIRPPPLQHPAPESMAHSASLPAAAMTPPPQPLHLIPPPPTHPTSLQPGQEGKVWSRTTEWRRRKAAEESAKQRGVAVPTRLTHMHYKCSKCGQPKTKEFGHTRVHNTFFCATAEGKTVDEWRAEQSKGTKD